MDVLIPIFYHAFHTVNSETLNVQLLTQLTDLPFKAKKSTEKLNCCQ